MLKEKIKDLKIKFAFFKIRRSRMKLMRYYLKSLEFCICSADEINIPSSIEEVSTMEELLSFYDEIIVKLNKNMDVYRRLISNMKE